LKYSMSSKAMTTLKDAQKKGKLNQFIKEREQEATPADKSKFDKALKSMTSGKKKSTRGTSGRGSS